MIPAALRRVNNVLDPLAAAEDAIRGEDASKVFGLFSGGHDSVCSVYVAAELPRFAGVVHINTGIGIEATREYVRETCRREGWPLHELTPSTRSYRDLIMERGFPYGTKAHSRTYYYLKGQQVERFVKAQKTHWYDRIGLVTGVRTAESSRRFVSSISVPVRRKGAQLWLNPIIGWDDTDKNAYMKWRGIPRNPVVDTMHKSGECLCGAYSRKDEFAELELWYPEEAARIRELEAEVATLPETILGQPSAGRSWAHRRERGGETIDPDEAAEFDLPLCIACARDAGT